MMNLNVIMIFFNTSCLCTHLLQVKVILSDRFPSLVIFSGQEAIWQPQNTIFMLPLGCEHPQHQDEQNNNHRHSNHVHEKRRLSRHRLFTWKIQTLVSTHQKLSSFDLGFCRMGNGRKV